MAKKDHKGIASDLVKDLIDNAPIAPMQESVIVKQKAPTTKQETDKFTVEIESELMKDVRLFSVNKKIKLRPLFEKALKEYITNHVND
jgi:hypothetical protein